MRNKCTSETLVKSFIKHSVLTICLRRYVTAERFELINKFIMYEYFMNIFKILKYIKTDIKIHIKTHMKPI